MAVFVTDGRKRGLPGARVTVALAMYYLFDFVAALVMVGLGLAVLVRRGRLETGEVVATVLLGVYAVVLAAWLILAWKAPDRLAVVLTKGGAFVNRLLRPFVHRDYLDVRRARSLAHDMAAGLTDLRQSRAGLLLPLQLCYHTGVDDLGLFSASCFSQPFTAGTLMRPTPSPTCLPSSPRHRREIGLIEGILTVALAGIGIPLATAALIRFGLHRITLWLTLLYGTLSFRWVGLGPKPDALTVGRTKPLPPLPATHRPPPPKKGGRTPSAAITQSFGPCPSEPLPFACQTRLVGLDLPVASSKRRWILRRRWACAPRSRSH
jgi:hypothetical protein